MSCYTPNPDGSPCDECSREDSSPGARWEALNPLSRGTMNIAEMIEDYVAERDAKIVELQEENERLAALLKTLGPIAREVVALLDSDTTPTPTRPKRRGRSRALTAALLLDVTTPGETYTAQELAEAAGMRANGTLYNAVGLLVSEGSLVLQGLTRRGTTGRRVQFWERAAEAEPSDG